MNDVAVLIDRREGGGANLKKAGVKLHAITDIIEMSDILYSKQMIGEYERRAIKKQVRTGTQSIDH